MVGSGWLRRSHSRTRASNRPPDQKFPHAPLRHYSLPAKAGGPHLADGPPFILCQSAGEPAQPSRVCPRIARFRWGGRADQGTGSGADQAAGDRAADRASGNRADRRAGHAADDSALQGAVFPSRLTAGQHQRCSGNDDDFRIPFSLTIFCDDRDKQMAGASAGLKTGLPLLAITASRNNSSKDGAS